MCLAFIKMVRVCIIDGCQGRTITELGISMHKLPTNMDVRKQWVEYIKLTTADFIDEHKSHVRLCSLHFEEGDFEEIRYCSS